MLKKISITFAVLLTAFLIFVVTRPSEFDVQRSIKISASPSDVFSYINNQLKWEEWSPWAKLDPNAEKFFGGAESGVGSVYKWSGNSEVGAGTSTIIESKKNELVKFQLDFEKPFKGTSFAEFTLNKEGNQTLVIWKMSGHKNFIMKLIGIFMNCDEMVGKDFEDGLESLKRVVEGN